MSIDIRTLFYIFSIGNLFTILFFSFYVFYYNVKSKIIHLFIISKILYAVLWILYALRHDISWFYSILLANVFLIFAIFIDLYCLLFANKPFNKNNFIKLCIIPFILSLIFTFVSKNDIDTRIIVFSFIILFLYISGAFLLFFKGYKTKIQRLSGLFCLGMSILLVVRILFAFSTITSLKFVSSSTIQIITYVFLFLSSFLFPMIFLLVLKEQDELKIKIDNELLKNTNKNKGKFISIIAHDLRGPLGTYNGLSKILLEQHQLMDTAKKELYMNKLYQSSKETYNLLENLLEWANAESGNITIKPVEIKLSKIVNNTVNFMLNNIYNKNINLSVNIDMNTTIYADYNMIMTVLRNLLSNAIKFTPNQGKISIYANLTKTNFIKITIEDSGVGIQKENLSNLLHVESNFTSKGTNNEGGTGLGLKLVKEFIVKNQGEINIESEVNKGTKVWFTLPNTPKQYTR